MKTDPLLPRLLPLAILAASAIPQLRAAIQLLPLWEIPAGFDTTVFPSYGTPATGSNSFDRGLAFNPVTGNLIVPTRSGGNRVLVLSKDRTNNPADPVNAIRELALGPAFLNTGTTFPLMQAGVGDDGAVYVCNLMTSAGQAPSFRIYRWASDAEDTVENENKAYAAFSGNPDSTGTIVRWGDVMAVRGSGVNTQILLGTNTTGVTSVAVLTTTNGFDFTSTILPGAVQGASSRGLTWGPPGENSFYSKSDSSTGAIRKTSFTLTPTPVATTVADTVISSQVGGGIIGPLYYHHASKRIAVLDLTGNGSAGSAANGDLRWTFTDKDYIRLHDINQTTGAVTALPVVATKELTNDPANGTAGNGNAGNGNRAGQVAIGDGKIFVCSTNKGIQAFTIFDDNIITPPVASVTPASAAAWTRGQLTLTGSATGTPPLTFQWLKNDQIIPGQTGATLTINPVTPADAGSYKFRATNVTDPTKTNDSPACVVTTPLSLDTGALTRTWQLAPGSSPWLTTTDTQRGMDVNPTLGRMYVVSRTPALSVQVLDTANGTAVGLLDTTGIAGGTFPLNMIGVAGDGKIYACNLAESPTPFQIYRWADDSPTTLPEVVFSGNPITGRMGDCMDVRGSGLSTEIVIGGRSSNYVIFKFMDNGAGNPPTMTAYPVSIPELPAGTFALGIAFGAGNEVWGKSPGTYGEAPNTLPLPLVRTGFSFNNATDPPTTTGTLLATIPAAQVANGNMGLGFDPVNSLIAFSSNELSDNVRLYRVTNPNTGTLQLLDQEFYTTDNVNGNVVGSAAFAGGKLYTLNTNNGIIAFNVSLAAAPVITNLQRTGNTFSFTLTGVSGASYLIQRSGDMAAWTDDGTEILDAGTSKTVSRTVTDGRYFFRAKAL